MYFFFELFLFIKLFLLKKKDFNLIYSSDIDASNNVKR